MRTINRQYRECAKQAYLPLTPIESLIHYLSEAYQRNSWEWSLLESVCREVDERFCAYDFDGLIASFRAQIPYRKEDAVKYCQAEVMLVRLYLHRLGTTSTDLRPLYLSLTLWHEKLLSLGYMVLMSYHPANPEETRSRLERDFYERIGAYWQAICFHQLWGDASWSDDSSAKQRACRRYAGPLFDRTFDGVSGLEEKRWLSLKADIAALSQVYPSQEVAQIDVSATRLRSALCATIMESSEQLISNLD